MNHIVNIYHTNDTHGHAETMAQRVQYLIDQKARAKEKGETAFVFDSGDVHTGTAYFRVYRGEDFATWMNKAGYDAMTFGNHEFDYGPEELTKFVKQLDFPVISSNVRIEDNSPLKEVYVGGIVTIKEGEEKTYGGKIYDGAIFERNGRKYGVFGLTAPETKKYVPREYGTAFADPHDTAVKMIKKLKAQGADTIILLSHLGYVEKYKMNDGTDLALATDPEIVKAGGIDFIVGGHTHTPITEKNFLKGDLELFDESTGETKEFSYATVIGQTEGLGKHIGFLRATLNEKGKIDALNLTGHEEAIAINAKDQDVKARYTKREERLEEKFGFVLGRLDQDMLGTSQVIRRKEAPLGNLVADASLWAARQFDPEVDVALYHGGGIRDSLPKGDVKYLNVLSVMAMPQDYVVLEITGEELRTALENGVSKVEQGEGRFPHMAGMRIEYDGSKQGGERISKVEILDRQTNSYQPLNAERTYKLVVPEFLTKVGIEGDGMDGYDVLYKVKEARGMKKLAYNDVSIKKIDPELQDAARFRNKYEAENNLTIAKTIKSEDAVAAYIRKIEKGHVPLPKIEGRIKAISKSEPETKTTHLDDILKNQKQIATTEPHDDARYKSKKPERLEDVLNALEQKVTPTSKNAPHQHQPPKLKRARL